MLLCEDSQHEAFARRFLRQDGHDLRNLRILRARKGKGSAEQYVREQFPVELAALRRRAAENVALIVLIDGDQHGVASRKEALWSACADKGVARPDDNDRVVVSVPTWNIETWLAFLDRGNADEAQRDYPRLSRPRDCKPHADKLLDLCRTQTPAADLPPSLADTCTQYRRIF